LGASSYYMSQLKSYSHFYLVSNLEDGEWEIEIDFTSQVYFQLAQIVSLLRVGDQ
jgi:hypothetical protein